MSIFKKIKAKKDGHKYVAIILQNKRNENKYLEIHRHGCRHTTCRQFMRWYLENDREIVNFTGDKKLHRISVDMMQEYLEDYKVYKIYR